VDDAIRAAARGQSSQQVFFFSRIKASCFSDF